MAALPEFEALRDAAVAIKNHAIAHLDCYLETYAAAVERSGGVVHWCATAEDSRQAVLKICRDAGARTVTKGKSMVTEEIGLNHFLEKNGVTPVETDLGEYVIQLRDETPSHIVAPALHLNRQDWEDSFRKAHTDLPATRMFSERRDILTEARGKLREKFLTADVGITGANFLIAETGTSVIVTNEGNGDLTQSLPRVHVVVTSIEKVLPTIEDTLALLRVLARSATGQDLSVYTTFSTGNKRPSDPDGPQEYHVVLLDNGRSGMVGTEFQDMLRCIRCAACMNHCPVYGAVGGHAYGATYPGPMGAVLSPMLLGVDVAGQLPNASTFCGKCESVCPVKIPLPNLMRHWREREFERHLQPVSYRYGPRPMGVVREAAGLVPDGNARGGIRTRFFWSQAWAFRAFAAGRKLDRYAGFSGAGGRYLLRALRARSAWSMSRQAIIGAIQRGLKRGPLPADQRAMLMARMAAHPRHIVPKRGQLEPEERVRLFTHYVEREFGTVARLSDLAAVPEAIARYLAEQNLAPTLVASPHPVLQAIEFEQTPMLSVRFGTSGAEDAVALQHGFAGIAETGTLMLPSGPTRPVLNNLLPDHAIVLLRAANIVASYEDAFDLLRTEGELPRNVMLVTGPSRSADIEQTLELGAHGPRRLHVLIIDGES